MLGFNLINCCANSQHYRTLHKKLNTMLQIKLHYGTSTMTFVMFILCFYLAIKAKVFPPYKCILSPQTLQPGHGPVGTYPSEQ